MRIGTRASALALAQATLVLHALGEGELVPILTRGDRESAGVDDSPGEIAGDGAPGEPPPGEDKSRWVSELERALLSGEIDVAVHSAKDVPGELADGLALVAAPARAACEDVLCGAASLDALPSGARVGTSSVRRIAQLRAARAEIEPVAMHGNVDTRLRKLADGELDAIVLARAGLQRLGREDASGAPLDPARFVPAPGQGTLALQARADDARAHDALAAIGDAVTLTCLLAERSLARALDADCDTPLGAWATRDGEDGSGAGAGRLRLRAWIGLPDGSAWIADELQGADDAPEELGRAVAERLTLAGAEEILRAARG
ncbi:MAG TPA: hydroxymethylbilane synthase [Solirubrobacteraceae bacterium]|jgi:hydroxymethylbilane synthase|nr:hydroxymethylbilane synthase [Solirubrobacteraceae bacterium]